MKEIARIMLDAMKHHEDTAKLAALRNETRALCARFPVPGL